MNVRQKIQKVARECLGLRVRMLSRVITGIYDDALSPLGLKVSQFSVLVAVTNREKARPAELAKILQMDESTLSRNVARMCARGWLRLEPDGDRRSHVITITEKGEALIRKGYPAWEKAQTEAARLLEANGVAALGSVVRKLHR